MQFPLGRPQELGCLVNPTRAYYEQDVCSPCRSASQVRLISERKVTDHVQRLLVLNTYDMGLSEGCSSRSTRYMDLLPTTSKANSINVPDTRQTSLDYVKQMPGVSHATFRSLVVRGRTNTMGAHSRVPTDTLLYVMAP